MPTEPPPGPPSHVIDLGDLALVIPELDVAVRRDAAGTAVVAVRGELDIATTRHLRECLDELLRTGHRNLRLELADLAFCDVAGLGVLLHTARCLRVIGGELVLTDPPPSLRRIVDALKLEDALKTVS